MYNPYSLENKIVLITGASSGIGRATAIECSKLGAKCIITGRDIDRLQYTYDNLSGTGHIQIIADLSNQDGICHLVDSIIEPIDGFVNNAGVTMTKPIKFIKQTDFDNLFPINLYSPVLLTKELIRRKKLNNGSSIVITSSVAAMTQAPGNVMYGMTKSAIISFAKYCALELSEKKIRVNTIHPGMVNTEMTQRLNFSREELDIDQEKYPLKRYAEPNEIAWSIIYLLSDASSWVTGSQLVIDGGIHLI